MAASLDAILNIKANVSGEGALTKLASGLGGVQAAAGKAGSGLKGLAGGAGGLGSALGGLVPLLSAAGLVAMGKAAINAADNMRDMSQRTGVSVETLSKFQQAANKSGSSIEGVQSGLLKLAKAMKASAGSTRDAGKDLVDAANRAAKAVERGEQAQTKLVEQNTNQRIRAIDREENRKLSSIERKYRKEEQRLRDILDGTSRADIIKREREEALYEEIDKRRQAEIDKVKADSEAKRTTLKADGDAQLQIIKDVAQAAKDALKKDAKENPLGDQLDELGLSGKGASEAFRSLGIDIMGSNGMMKATDEVMLEVADKFKAMPDGIVKSTLAMKLFGKGGTELIPMLNEGRDSIESLAATMSTGFAKAADQFNDKTEELQAKFMVMGVQIGTALLPVLQKITNEVMWMVKGFMDMDPATQQLIGIVAGVVIAFAALAPTILGVISLIGTLIPIVSAVVAGFAQVVGVIGLVIGAIASVGAAPVIIAAAIAAAVVALVAGVFLFRKEILNFFVWLGKSALDGWKALTAPIQPLLDGIGAMFQAGIETLGTFWTGAATLFYQTFVEPIQKSCQFLWGLIAKGWEAAKTVAGNIFRAIADTYRRIVVDPIVGAWTKIVDTAKGALRGLMGWAAGAINGVIDLVNRVIGGINSVRSAAGLSTYGIIGRVQVPAFADGGYVEGKTLAMMGDNRSGKEYAIPEEKVVSFANNIMAGRRGAAAIPGAGASSTPPGSPQVAINLTIGSVRQDAAGTHWMTVEDGQKMVRDAMGQYARIARTPGGRYQGGVR